METNMDYNLKDCWSFSENKFDVDYQGKCESIMSIGNGYMGIRSAAEETYIKQTRGMFVAGTFNKFDESEVTELPNCADIMKMNLTFDKNHFDLNKGNILEYKRELNLKNGELTRNILWKDNSKVKLSFSRFVSMDQLHTIGQKVKISVDKDTIVKIQTGIDATTTNSGTQHFTDGEKRFYDKKILQLTNTTIESKINFVVTSCVNLKINGKSSEVMPFIELKKRCMFCTYSIEANANDVIEIEKISYITTSRDADYSYTSLEEQKSHSLKELTNILEKNYDELLQDSANKWNEVVWHNIPVTIKSKNPFDILAMRFAQYHLQIMTPAHDSRMNIAAKGLSGEGYKGHTFWDNEIFTLPYFTFTQPQIARSLCKYRFLSLEGAHKKAAENNYKGAQFPWESAWLSDGEVTPIWGAADIHTGLPTKIWSGFKEQHITADVAFGIWQYYMMTKDKEFMEKYGYELLFDTAKFWVSRLEFSKEDELYHINDVVGPDEYKEHVDDNAFTNYMAHWNIKVSMEYINKIKNTKLYARLNSKLDLDLLLEKSIEVIDKIYLPKPRKQDLVIPQDKNYLSLKQIDLTKYKSQKNVGSLFSEYSLEQVNQIQVSKQADTLILFFLLENLFSEDVKLANFKYYEERTLHDSSLSLSTHAILASDMKNRKLAYELFNLACKIDLGENMKTSDEGIHAASIAGIWQSVIFGFAGVRMLNGDLRINPHLPDEIEELDFYIWWQKEKLHITVNEKGVSITNLTNTKEITILVMDKRYTLNAKTPQLDINTKPQ